MTGRSPPCNRTISFSTFDTLKNAWLRPSDIDGTHVDRTKIIILMRHTLWRCGCWSATSYQRIYCNCSFCVCVCPVRLSIHYGRCDDVPIRHNMSNQVRLQENRLHQVRSFKLNQHWRSKILQHRYRFDDDVAESIMRPIKRKSVEFAKQWITTRGKLTLDLPTEESGRCVSLGPRPSVLQ